MTLTKIDQLCINTIRFLSAEAVQKANIGHPGTPMGLAPLGYTLWTKHLKHNPSNPHWINRDRFVLSAGHASMLLYSLLHLTGYNVSLSDIKNFRQWESKTPGHPEFGHTAGVETTTGPLGQGIGNAVGMALAEKHLAALFNKENFPVVDHYTYAIVSDGDLMEGVSHEACSLAGHLKLGKLIVFYDDNNITIDGKTDLAFSEDIRKRFESYGWKVHLVKDGNKDIISLDNAIEQAQKETKPSLIIVKTIIGYGAPNKQNTAGAHGAPLGEEEIRLAKQKLDWKHEEPFFIPQKVKEEFLKTKKDGKKKEKEWDELFEEYKKKHPNLAKQFHQFFSGKLPKNWEENLPLFDVGEQIATRKSSGTVLNKIAPSIQNFIGGSADLHPSTNTYLKEFGSFSDQQPEARNVHYGIREHAMGAITNGITLHQGLIPLCSTFLVFSDYMRPTMRLAALMGIQSIFVFTHDSIGVGEDGPTHQPVEHITSLRAIPNMVVLRPGDANEVRGAWRTALERTDGPTTLILSRQKMLTLTSTKKNPDSNVAKGAYILEDSEGKPDVILLGSGSELHLLVEARKELKKKKIDARVVSFPSWELFKRQDKAYREKVLPHSIRARLSVEAGISLGWEQFVGNQGTSISVEKFGASAPGNLVLEKYGFTVENVVKHAVKIVKETR